MFAFIHTALPAYSIAEKCKALDVTKQGYYKWLRNRERPYKHAVLLAQIQAVLAEHTENQENYGFPRVYLRLTHEEYGFTGSPSTVRRVMRANGLLLKKRPSPKGLTKADHGAQKSENLIGQNFRADEPNRKWLTDISEVPTADGKLYIAPVMDCFNGEIVGLAMADNMRKELCISAFEQACKRYGAHGVICHSDRGAQFTSHEFRNALKAYGAVQSMSGTGRCYDNARMESFFATLKKEKLYKVQTKRLPMATVKSIIFRWIFTYYNTKRIYTANDSGYPPSVKRRMHRQHSGDMAA